MKWQQVLVVIMVWSALLVGVAQEADVAVTEVVELIEVNMEGENFTLVLSSSEEKISLSQSRILQGESYFSFEKGFFTQETQVDFVISAKTNLLVDMKDLEVVGDPISPTITISFPYQTILSQPLTLENYSRVAEYIIPTFPNTTFLSDDSEYSDVYLNRFSFSTTEKEIGYQDFIINSYDQGGFLNTNTLRSLYDKYGDDTIVKVVIQVVRIKFPSFPTQN